MQSRIDFARIAPGGVLALRGLDQYASQSGLDDSLLQLVKVRVSQINGCGYCIDMHSREARARGETEQRLYGLVAWDETPFYSERERAALEWAEAVTLVADGPIDEDTFDSARAHFSDRELVDLTIAINAINSWNRLAMAFGSVPGSYRPANGD